MRANDRAGRSKRIPERRERKTLIDIDFTLVFPLQVKFNICELATSPVVFVHHLYFFFFFLRSSSLLYQSIPEAKGAYYTSRVTHFGVSPGAISLPGFEQISNAVLACLVCISDICVYTMHINNIFMIK